MSKKRTIFVEIVASALLSLLNRKMRAFLTITGVIIGITSVVGMTGLLRGLDTSMKTQLLALSADVFFVARAGGRLMAGDEYRRLMERAPVTRDDAVAIGRHVPEVAEVALIVDTTGTYPAMSQIRYGNTETADMPVIGTSSNYFEVYQDDIAEGRFFTEAEDRAGRAVVVLGAGPAEILFGAPGDGGIRAEGKQIRFAGQRWTVVGVLEKRPSLMGQDGGENSFVIVPTRAFERIFPADNRSYQIGVQPMRDSDPARVMEDVIQLMRLRRGLKVHDDNDFDVITQETLLELWDNLTRTIMFALTALSSVALLVGGIGVMAVMLVTVTERIAEIGVRMATGARRQDIMLQFLVEAAILTSTGGFLGIMIGVSLGWLLSYGTGLPVSFPAWSYGISLLSSVVIGIIFGVYPAYRAARMNPVEALRHRKA